MPRDPLAAMEAHLAEMHEAFALTKGKRKDGTRTHIPAPKTERGRQSAQARGYRLLVGPSGRLYNVVSIRST